ncbi:putative S-acyltransferase [Dendrobium catenatum]|uniref:Putative S-acyltransferase n=1 Tax=Dendrobium catenatum TaxID=906689 RepID=A0A2I0X7S8_9ASPA|nr:putative S-acyltransferase [Dendrobium catenatum]
MDTVPLETHLNTTILTWLHLLRLRIGFSFLLTQSSTHTRVTYTRLFWVRQSFRPALEHDARRYEGRVWELGVLRRQRSCRGFSEVTVDREMHIEARATTGAIVLSLARAPDVAPAHIIQRSADKCSYTTEILRDLISSIDSGSPESWDMFTSSADQTLSLLTSFKMDSSELLGWETLRREVEYYVRRLSSFSILRAGATLPELEARVVRRQAAAYDADDQFDRSVEALRRHWECSSRMGIEEAILTARTTYENFRYRYDRRANPYNLGVVENFKEIFFTSIPPSKNNFRARVPQEQGLQPRQSAGGFMSPNMGKGVVDIEVGRKAMAWGEHEAAACIDIDAGLRNEATDDKDGGLNESSLGSDHILPFEGLGVRAAVEHRQRPLSWGEEQW